MRDICWNGLFIKAQFNTLENENEGAKAKKIFATHPLALQSFIIKYTRNILNVWYFSSFYVEFILWERERERERESERERNIKKVFGRLYETPINHLNIYLLGCRIRFMMSFVLTFSSVLLHHLYLIGWSHFYKDMDKY